MLDDESDFSPQHISFEFPDTGQIELVNKLRVYLAFQIFKFDLFLVVTVANSRGAGVHGIVP